MKFKTLFKKAVGSLILNFKEATTILTQTEAILNSRHLSPIETLRDDGVDVLTPGHFLIARPLTALPPLNTTTGKSTSLRRWNHIQKVNDEFWVRWSGEYINHLNKTRKWLTPGRNLCAGDIVMCKELPEVRPRTWPLARVTRTFPGTDDRVRVVDLLCSGKLYRRPASKVIVLVPAPEDGSAQIFSRSVAEKVVGNGGPPLWTEWVYCWTELSCCTLSYLCMHVLWFCGHSRPSLSAVLLIGQLNHMTLVSTSCCFFSFDELLLIYFTWVVVVPTIAESHGYILFELLLSHIKELFNIVVSEWFSFGNTLGKIGLLHRETLNNQAYCNLMIKIVIQFRLKQRSKQIQTNCTFGLPLYSLYSALMEYVVSKS